MNIIVSYLYNDRKIDGSIINAFEYFYTLYELKQDVKLLIYTYQNIEQLIVFLKNKFNVDNKCFNNVTILKYPELLKEKTLLVDGYSVEHLPNKLKNCEILAIPGYNVKNNPKVKYFRCYNFLMDDNFNVYEYKQSLRLDLFKEFKSKEGIFLNSPHNPNVYPDFKSDKKIYRREDLQCPNLYQYFNEMIYIQNPKIIDRKPRCFFECQYFNIPYTYIYNGIKDGSFYRYNDYNIIKMNENDLIINEFLNH